MTAPHLTNFPGPPAVVAHMPRLVLLLVIALTLASAGCPKLARTIAEADNKRVLINGYDLWLLKGFPYTITNQDSSGPRAHVPTSSQGGCVGQSVARYTIVHHWIVGDPDTVADKIRALHQQVGGFGTLLVIAHEWPDPAVWDRSMTLLAEEVLPQLADLGAPATVPA